MRDATYVVVALALCMLVLLVFSLNKPRPISMMDMREFKNLPLELRAAVRRMLPDPTVIRQRWATMTPGQKQMVIQQISGVIPQPRPPAPDSAPTSSEPVSASRPPEPEPTPLEEKPIVVEEAVDTIDGLKKGFLLGDTKKKNPKNKKKNEVITLSSVAPGDDAPSDGFLGHDE